MEGKPQNRMQEVSADEIGRQLQVCALYCRIYAYWDSELYCGGAGKMAKHLCDEEEAFT